MMCTTRIQPWHIYTILLLLTLTTDGTNGDNDVNHLKPIQHKLDEHHRLNNNQAVEPDQLAIEVQEDRVRDDGEVKQRKRDTAHNAESKRPMDRVFFETSWQLESFPLLKVPVARSPFPTFGMVWPLPRFWMVTQRFYPILADKLEFRLTLTTNHILQAAIKRYHQLILARAGVSPYANLWIHQEDELEKARKTAFDEKRTLEFGTGGTDPLSSTAPSSSWDDAIVHRFHRTITVSNEDYTDGISLVHVHINSPGLAWPHEHMDESYTLSATERGIHLYAHETWGGLRGLESLSQLMWCTSNRKRLYINQTFIKDHPRFRHRGLMIDTSRHYISKDNIFLNLEAMSYNKMNVFHWHITDDQSFPYQSETFPELSEKGAYSPNAVYTPSDIKEIIQFARLRGIRVIPEFDVPGHTRSMSLSKPEITSTCTLNPLSSYTIEFLHKLFKEVIQLFRDQYLHVGGDEVETSCWSSDSNLQRLRSKLKLESPKLVLEYFWRNLQNMFTSIGAKDASMKRNLIMWEDVLELVTGIRNGTLIQVWKSTPESLLQNRQRIIYSTCWYLDHLRDIDGWTSFYLCDPTTGQSGRVDPSYEELIVGGEACMWTEYQTDDTILQKIWPVTAAVAERLWSSADVNKVSTLEPRLQEQSCRLSSRGIPVQSLMGPGHCEVPRKNINIERTAPCTFHDSHFWSWE